MTSMGTPLGVGSRSGGGSAVTFDGFVSYSHAGDDLLAPRLHSALQKFAKPWWKRRALRVFRDEASLSANPHLWSSITEALDTSGWFVLLTSPEAASSPWVNKEVEYWLANRGADRILPVLTDGTFAWDERAGRLDPSSSVPPALLEAFSEEPRWVDLRWARVETDLDLRNSRFRAAVADVASALRGVAKDELESEEVRQHRRTIRTAWAAGVALVVLTGASVVASVYANQQRAEAESQRSEAESQRAEAESQRAEAERQGGIALSNGERAEQEASRAVEAERLARSRELAASAINVLDDDPELSILLALEAMAVVPEGEAHPVESVSALREAVHTSNVVRRERVAEDGYVWVAVSPDGTRLAVAAEETGEVLLIDTDTWETVDTYSEDTLDTVWVGYFSPDGRYLTLSYLDSTSLLATFIPPEGAPDDDGVPARIVVLDAKTLDVVSTFEYPDCPTSFTGNFSPDGRYFSVLTGGYDDDGWCGEWRADIIETTTWDLYRSIPFSYALPEWIPGDNHLLDAMRGEIYDIETGEKVGGTATPVAFALASPDGATIAGVRGGGVHLYDTESGAEVDRLTGSTFEPFVLLYSGDGSMLMAGTDGADSLVWDLDTGELVHRLRTGPVSNLAYDTVRKRLYHGTTGGTYSVWDLSGASSGELDTRASGIRIEHAPFSVSPSYVGFVGLPDWILAGNHLLDLTDMTFFDGGLATVKSNAGAILPDGRVVRALVRETEGDPLIGPVGVWDPRSGEVTELIGCWSAYYPFGEESVPCLDGEEQFTFFGSVYSSPDENQFLVGSDNIASAPTPGTSGLIVFDSATLAEVHRLDMPALGGVRGFGGTWAIVLVDPNLVSIDLDSGETLHDFGPDMIGSYLRTVEISPSGDAVAVGDALGGLTVTETSAWSEIVGVPDAHAGRIVGLSFNADGSRLMTAGSDGLVKVWDVSSGAELTRIPMAKVVDGLWLDDQHILVGTHDGVWTTLTLDVDELIDLARSRLSRGLTSEECTVYRIEPCPAD